MLQKVVYPLFRNGRIPFYESTPIIYRICQRQSSRNALTKSKRTELGTDVKPIGEKVKETTKTASYLGVILLGVGVTGALFYAVFSELFSSTSPNNVYAKASKRCINDNRIKDALGEPIVVYGEETRRHRRQHASHLIYERNGKKHLRMKFYLKGSFRKGTAQLEMIENDYGKYDYRYLFVEVEDLLGSTVVLEDNRTQELLSNKDSLLI